MTMSKSQDAIKAYEIVRTLQKNLLINNHIKGNKYEQYRTVRKIIKNRSFNSSK